MRSVSRLIFAASALVALAGCSSDSSVAPVSRPATLDGALGELTLSAIMPAGVTSTFPGAAASLTPNNCAFDAASRSFICATVNGSGYTINSSFDLLNSSGAAQSAFDQATTAAIRTKSTVTGSQVINGETFSTDVAQTLTLSGLLSGVHTLNGTQLLKLTSTPAGGTASTMTVSTTITELVLPAEPGPGRYPRSGTIAQTLSAPGRAGMPALNSSTLITFNGTSKVDVVISFGPVSQHCIVDLAASAPSCS